ncbi:MULTISPECIES: hypothetical protein [unclassified Streptomyces]|uniref:hypothetical protein n=1 Tax=unclassified Streptomyces TaxID=2593676 RepID=UPI0016606602|nr:MULTISPECIES: hypothetical protein [unclassified Streptomyces]MBD0710691.1 hypothetical protein [Streptomyces sp. CBMA291]MBD0715538.1 hypothetical protein [Streptomyces sp. CBMA370]
MNGPRTADNPAARGCGAPGDPVRPHLHLHLEPEERKRRELGLAPRDFSSRDRFFAAHRTDRADRPRTSPGDLGRYLAQVHAEQRAQGADLVELRLSPRRLLLDGMTWEDFTSTAQRVLGPLRDPVVSAVLLVNRNSPADFVGELTDRIGELPPVFVGLDVAGDELAHPDVRPFVPLARAAADAGLGRTVHAGEFGPPEHVWRALDLLGADRIGHGLSCAASAALLRRMATDGILAEVSLTSNLALGAVPAPASHPLPAILAAGVPVSLNTDVPLHTGHTLTDELDLATQVLDLSPGEIRALQTRAAAARFPRRPSGPANPSAGSTPRTPTSPHTSGWLGPV